MEARVVELVSEQYRMNHKVNAIAVLRSERTKVAKMRWIETSPIGLLPFKNLKCYFHVSTTGSTAHVFWVIEFKCFVRIRWNVLDKERFYSSINQVKLCLFKWFKLPEASEFRISSCNIARTLLHLGRLHSRYIFLQTVLYPWYFEILISRYFILGNKLLIINFNYLLSSS